MQNKITSSISLPHPRTNFFSVLISYQFLKRTSHSIKMKNKQSCSFLEKFMGISTKKNLLFVFRQFLRYRLCLLLDQCHSSTNSSNNNACVSLHIKVLFIPIENKMYISLNQQFQMSECKDRIFVFGSTSLFYKCTNYLSGLKLVLI